MVDQPRSFEKVAQRCGPADLSAEKIQGSHGTFEHKRDAGVRHGRQMGISTSSLTCAHRALRSRVGLHVDPRAVISDSRGRGRVIYEETGRQELPVGRQVGADLLLEHSARNLVDHLNPDRTAIGRCGDEQGQHPTRRDSETRPHVCQRRRAGAVVRDQLPAGVRAALEADTAAVLDRGGGPCRGNQEFPSDRLSSLR